MSWGRPSEIDPSEVFLFDHAGFTLGKGTAMWRAFLEQATGSQSADLAAQIAKLSLGNAATADEGANGAAPQGAAQLCAAVKARLNLGPDDT